MQLEQTSAKFVSQNCSNVSQDSLYLNRCRYVVFQRPLGKLMSWTYIFVDMQRLSLFLHQESLIVETSWHQNSWIVEDTRLNLNRSSYRSESWQMDWTALKPYHATSRSWDPARFEFKMIYGRISYIATFAFIVQHTVLFKTRGHPSCFAWLTQCDALSCFVLLFRAWLLLLSVSNTGSIWFT